MTRSTSTFIALIVVTPLYIAAGKLGLSMAFLNASASPVWPPTGLALAAMMLLGYRMWPAVLVGAFVVNLTTAGTVTTAAVIAVGNTLEAVVGTMIARRFAGGLAAFELAPNVFRFAFFAVVPATMLSATVGVTCLAIAHFVPWNLYGPVWMTWWTGDFVGGLVVAPLLIIWAKGPWAQRRGDQTLEGAALATVLILLADLIFIRWHARYAGADALAYLSLLPLIWAAFRFQQRGAVTAAFALSVFAVRGTLRGAGPFAVGDANESLLLLQTFMGVNTLMALILAAVVAERGRADEERTRILQREQTARAEAEHANRTKDQFLAVLSHELRTPLTPVLLASSLLENDPSLPRHLGESAQMIRRNVEMEARLIDDLLDLTRVSRGKLQLSLVAADVHEAVRRAVEICCAERAGDLVLELGATRHHVRGDPARLQQVFWNLVNNAVKFTASGKTIAVRSRDADTADAVDIEVSDNGVGIEPRVLPRLFNAFEQGSDERARKFGGLGLGLAITKALVEAHGGIVTASSAGPNQGATFTVRLPIIAKVEQKNPEPAPSGRQPGSAPARVLLVEDHVETLDVLSRLLKYQGHDVTTASSIQTALTAARREQFDLVISDLGLPDGLGYELMRSLREQYHLRGIALSGYGMSEDIQKSREAGFAEHLVKPVDLKKLEEAMTRVLASRE